MPKNNLTLQEASDFFDEHDLEDFSHSKEVKIRFRLSKKKYIGLEAKLFNKIAKLARLSHLSSEQMIHRLLQKEISG